MLLVMEMATQSASSEDQNDAFAYRNSGREPGEFDIDSALSVAELAERLEETLAHLNMAEKAYAKDGDEAARDAIPVLTTTANSYAQKISEADLKQAVAEKVISSELAKAITEQKSSSDAPSNYDALVDIFEKPDLPNPSLEPDQDQGDDWER